MIKKTTKNLPPAIFLMGPTGTGKTDLAVQLLNSFAFDLISVDSVLVYKEMDIGTAKPDQATLRRAPHRLIDFLSPSENYSAASFRQDALQEMKNITNAGRIPLLVGGTLLYFRALEQGLAVLPAANAEIRQKLVIEAKQKGWLYLHNRLQKIDPDAAKKIHPNDKQRLQRALEVYELTGKAITSLHKKAKKNSLPYRLLKISLIPKDREWLKTRLEQRFDLMLEQGFIAEVKRLYQRKSLNLDLPSIRSVGYRQVWQYLQGDIDYNEMRNRAIVATRKLAKRQMTWLRSEKELLIYDAQQDNLSSIKQQLEAFLCQ